MNKDTSKYYDEDTNANNGIFVDACNVSMLHSVTEWSKVDYAECTITNGELVQNREGKR